MMQGTKKTQMGYVCANCNKIVSKEIEDIDNYCSHCGTALKIESIIERKALITDEKLNVLDKIVSYNNQGFSINKIIETIKVDIDLL